MPKVGVRVRVRARARARARVRVRVRVRDVSTEECALIARVWVLGLGFGC